MIDKTVQKWSKNLGQPNLCFFVFHVTVMQYFVSTGMELYEPVMSSVWTMVSTHTNAKN